MSRHTVYWVVWALAGLALETWALTHDHRWTLSQTLRRAFAHAPWVTLVLFGALVAWLTVHLWAPLLVHATKTVTKVTYRLATKYVGKGRR